MTRILMVGAEPSSLVNFRGTLLIALVELRHDVTAMAAPASAETRETIESMGLAFRPFAIARSSLNPLSDLRTLLNLRRAIRDGSPDVVIAYTIKPVIWTGIALMGTRKPKFYALITGLGYAFEGHGLSRRLLTWIASNLYRASLGRADAVIFQNPDNKATFVQREIVEPVKCHIVNGSGVDVDRFSPAPLPASSAPIFLTIARLLGEKGLREYAAAAAIVKARFPDAEFHLVGPPDPSPDGIEIAEVEEWVRSGAVTYHGATKDVKGFIARCHVFVLASYHEGMPRTVLEAMAMARPILTTDVSGCRETVRTGENGYLVPKADPVALAERMIWFIEHRERWVEMGTSSRRMAEERFDVHKVNADMLRIMNLL